MPKRTGQKNTLQSDLLISVVAVTQNHASATQFLIELSGTLNTSYRNYEIVLVDNGSADDFLKNLKTQVSKSKNTRLIILSKRYSIETATIAGLEQSIGDFVILMDGNSDPVNIVPKLVSAAQAGNDIVIAEKEQRHDNFLRLFFIHSFYTLVRVLTDYKVHPQWSNFICLSRRAANAITKIHNKNKYLKYINVEIGFRHAIVSYKETRRTSEASHWNVFADFSKALDIITGSSNKLLRIATRLAFLTGVVSAFYILYVLAIFIFDNQVVEGWTTTSFFISSMFSVLFLVLGIVGEYISYIYEEIKKSPDYYIIEEVNSPILLNHGYKSNIVKKYA